MKMGLIFVLLTVGIFGCAPLAAATFSAFPTTLYLYPGETRHVKIAADIAGVIKAAANAGSPGPYTMTAGEVTGSGYVELECTASDSVSSPFTASKSFTCSLSPPGQPAQTGTAFVTVAVLPDPSTAAANLDHATAGDPVNTRTGEYYALEAMDLNLGGPMPLFFARYYASRLAADARTLSSFGANRLHHFESRLVYPGSRHADIITNRGRVISFAKSGKTWTLVRQLDVPYRLVENGGEFILGHPHSQQMWTYDSVSGRLLRIEDGRGNVHTLTYGGVAPNRLESVSDGLGRTLTFAYNGTGKLITVTDQIGRHVDFVHAGAVLASATSAQGFTTTYAHTGNLLTSFTRPEGNTPFTQVHTSGRVTSQTERTTDTSTLSYLGLTTTFTDPSGETIVDIHNSNGDVLSHVDQAGKAIAMTYDATGRRTSVTDRLGHTTSVTYHAPSGLPELITTAEGRTSKRTYKARTVKGMTFYDLATVLHPDGSSRAFTYDAKGNLSQVTDEAGKKWKFTHNGMGRVLTVTNPLGGITAFTYDSFGNLVSSRDADTEATTYGYDAAQRLATVTPPGVPAISMAYDDDDRLVSKTDERGHTFEYAHDDNGRLTGVTDPDAKSLALGYDGLDRLNTLTDRLGKVRSLVHDSRRLPATFTDRNGLTTTWQFDARQRPVGTVDAGAKVWPRTFDDEGLLASFATPIDPPATIRRNRLGRAVELSDPLGHTQRWTRDARQRVVQHFDPLGRVTVFAYDKRGLLTAVTEQGTGTAKFDRNGLGQVAKMTDPNGGIWNLAYTKAGRLLSLTDPLGRKTSQTYDGRGLRDVTTFADSATETRSYDNAGNLTRRLFSDGTDLTYAYDNLNRLVATVGVEFLYDAEGRLANCRQNDDDFTATYDDGGRLATVTYLDGAVVVNYQHDSRDRLTRVSDSVSGAQIDFTYDDAGRLLTTTRSNGVHGARTYDSAGRLTGIVESGFLDLKYSLNAAGEVTALDMTAPSLPAVSPGPAAVLKFNKASQVAITGFAYDPRGRLSASPGKTWQWDGASRLISAAGVVLTYNGLGDVTSRTAAAATTTFAHHYALRRAPIVVETPAAGAPRCYVWTPDGRLLYAIDLGTMKPTFYHFDRLGSTLALTDFTGGDAGSYAYGPYGELLADNSGSSQPFTYIGEWGVRAEGGLYHMRARYYDPATARFLSRDPAPIALRQAKRLNVYEYAAQNPIVYIDPDGGAEGPPLAQAPRAPNPAPGSYVTPENRVWSAGATGIFLMYLTGKPPPRVFRVELDPIAESSIPAPTFEPGGRLCETPRTAAEADTSYFCEQVVPYCDHEDDLLKPPCSGTTPAHEFFELSLPPGCAPLSPFPVLELPDDWFDEFNRDAPDSVLDQIEWVLVIS